MNNTVLLTIPEVTPTNNQLTRMHWAKQRRVSKDWKWLVMLAMQQWEKDNTASILPTVDTKRLVTIKSFRHNKVDPDNLYGGCKPLLDGLTNNCLIVDDSSEWIDLKVFGEIDRKNKRTMVELCCF